MERNAPSHSSQSRSSFFLLWTGTTLWLGRAVFQSRSQAKIINRIQEQNKEINRKLRTSIRRQSATVQRLSLLLSVTSQQHPFHLVWILVHIGIDRNERVDKLAKTGLELPLVTQAKIQMDMVDIKN